MWIYLGEKYGYGEGYNSGYCGESITWSLADGVLEFQGSGYMKDWKRITIFQNVFENCRNLKHVRLQNIDLIGCHAFKGCPVDTVELSSCNYSLKKHSRQLQFGAFASSGIRELRLTVTTLLNIPSLTHSIEDDCFKDCDRLKDIYFMDRLPAITPAAIPNPGAICFHIKKSSINETVLRKLFGKNIHIEYL